MRGARRASAAAAKSGCRGCAAYFPPVSDVDDAPRLRDSWLCMEELHGLRQFPNATLRSVVLHCLFVCDDEVHKSLIPGEHANVTFPSSGSAKDSPLDRLLGEDIYRILPAQHMPSFVPSNNFIVSRGNVSTLEPAILVSNCVVRMRNYHHFSIHPNMPAVTPQVHNPWCVHVSRNHPIGERKRQVKRGSTVHVNCVKHMI